MPAGLLLGAYEPHLPVELVGLLLEKQLPGLDAEEVGDDVDEHDGGDAGDDSGGDLGNCHDDGDGPGVHGECPEVDEVGGAAEDDEGAELDEHPSVGEEGGLVDEVDELERDGEVGERDEEVGDVLVLDEQLIGGPEGLDAVAALHSNLDLGGCEASRGMLRLSSWPAFVCSLAWTGEDKTGPTRTR